MTPAFLIGSSNEFARRFSARRLILFLALVFLVNSLYFAQHPFRPIFPNWIGEQWPIVTGEAAAQRKQWGTDIIVTYGPTVSLATNYYTALFPILNIVGSAIISLIAAFAILLLSDGNIPRVVLLTVLLSLTMSMTLMQDSFFLALVYLFFLLAISTHGLRQWRGIVALVAAIALGPIALSKLTIAMTTLPLLLIADIKWSINRSAPLLTIAFIISIVSTYLAFGQSLSFAPLFLELQTEIIRGYSEAMAFDGMQRELIAFLLVSILLGACVLWIERKRGKRSSILDISLSVLGAFIYWLVAFKAGFVRHDLHSLIGWQSLGIAATIFALARGAAADTKIPSVLVLVVGLLCVLVIAPTRLAAALDGPGQIGKRLYNLYENRFIAAPKAHWTGLFKYLSGPSEWVKQTEDTKVQAWRNIREQRPLRRLSGSVDIIPSDQAIVIANDLDYHPRPVFQEYFAYTPRLIDTNRDFFASPLAPDWLLFAPGSIDNRYPNSAEGALWPDFIRRYEPDSIDGNLLVLRRRALPKPEIFGPGRLVNATFGEKITITEDAPVFAKIHIEKSALGKALSAIFRLPIVSMQVKLADGTDNEYRIVPPMAASGFVISPLIDNTRSYLAMASGRLELLTSKRVESIQVTTPSWAQFAFSNIISIELVPLLITKAPSTISTELQHELASLANFMTMMRGILPTAVMEINDDGLFAHAPSSLKLRARPTRRISLGFGIRDGSWRFGKTDGVCFRVVAEGATHRSPLFERCLRPTIDLSDRGTQRANIDVDLLDDTVLVFETSCIENCSWDWSYWNRIVLE